MNISIVISSCDLYSDCWKPMSLSLKENWRDCMFPIYLISNYKDSGDNRIKAIKVGEHRGWGSNTKKALEVIDTDYVLLLQEDYFLNAPMTDDVLLKHVAYCEKNDIDYLRLGAPFYDKNRTDNDDYCVSPADKPFSMCLQPAIWKRQTLAQLTFDGWTGWDYERRIHKYIKNNNLVVKSMVIHSSKEISQGYTMVHGTAIRRGIWTEGGIEFLERHGFYEEVKGRKREGKLLSKLNDVQSDSLLIIPAKILRKTLQYIKRIL